MQRLCEDVEPHVHEPWGYSPEQGLATAMEAQYPNGMCGQLVRVLMKFVWKKDSECSPLTANLHVRQTTAWQGHSTADSEDEKVCSVLLDVLPSTDAKRCLYEHSKHVPAGSRLLRTEKKGEKLLCVLGFHLCETFVALAKTLWHPFVTQLRICLTIC